MTEKLDESKVSRDEHGKVSIRFARVISEIHQYSGKDNEQLIACIKKQSRELLVFFCLFVVYVLVGAFAFFYIEECSDAAMADDGSTPSFKDTTEPVKFKNVTATCVALYRSIKTDLYNHSSYDKVAFENYLTQCADILSNSFDEYVRVAKHTRSCVVNEFQVLKYAEYTIFTLLTVGYGNTTPVTIIGRYMLIIYALFGVPIAVSMYSMAGKLLTLIYTHMIRCFQTRILNKKTPDKFLQVKVLILSCFMMLLITLFGCLVTTHDDMENWSFSTSLYFWFVSLTTIGYGDIHFDRNKHLNSIHFLFLSAGNLLFGLGISAAIIEAFSQALEKRQFVLDKTDHIESDEQAKAGSSSNREERKRTVLFSISEENGNEDVLNNNWYLTDGNYGNSEGRRNNGASKKVGGDDDNSMHSDTSYFHGSNVS